jgi:hypothetical protein
VLVRERHGRAPLLVRGPARGRGGGLGGGRRGSARPAWAYRRGRRRRAGRRRRGSPTGPRSWRAAGDDLLAGGLALVVGRWRPGRPARGDGLLGRVPGLGRPSRPRHSAAVPPAFAAYVEARRCWSSRASRRPCASPRRRPDGSARGVVDHQLRADAHDDLVAGHRDHRGRGGGDAVDPDGDVGAVLAEHVGDRHALERVAAGGVQVQVDVVDVEAGDVADEVVGGDARTSRRCGRRRTRRRSSRLASPSALLADDLVAEGRCGTTAGAVGPSSARQGRRASSARVIGWASVASRGRSGGPARAAAPCRGCRRSRGCSAPAPAPAAAPRS